MRSYQYLSVLIAEKRKELKDLIDERNALPTARCIGASGGAVNNIRRIRRDRNITGKQLAAAVGVSVAAVSRWERGLRNLSPHQYQRVVDALGASMTEVFPSIAE